MSAHYTGNDLVPSFDAAEDWTKVFGPVFIYVNSISDTATDPHGPLWEDAKLKVLNFVLK